MYMNFIERYKHVLNNILQTYQVLIPSLFFIVDLTFLDLLDYVGLASIYAREAL